MLEIHEEGLIGCSVSCTNIQLQSYHCFSINRTAHVENDIWLLQAVLCWTVQRVAPWVPNPRPATTFVNCVHTIKITQLKYLGIPLIIFFHIRHANKATVTGVTLSHKKGGHPWFTLWEDVIFKWTVYFRFPVCS